jgi:hypothetical protein
MDEINGLPQAPSCKVPALSTPHGVGLPLRLTPSPSFAGYLRYAVQVLVEFDLPSPGEDRLALMVEAALSAQVLLFAACLHDPDELELHRFFEMFILNCVIPPETRSNS